MAKVKCPDKSYKFIIDIINHVGYNSCKNGGEKGEHIGAEGKKDNAGAHSEEFG